MRKFTDICFQFWQFFLKDISSLVLKRWCSIQVVRLVEWKFLIIIAILDKSLTLTLRQPMAKPEFGLLSQSSYSQKMDRKMISFLFLLPHFKQYLPRRTSHMILFLRVWTKQDIANSHLSPRVNIWKCFFWEHCIWIIELKTAIISAFLYYVK